MGVNRGLGTNCRVSVLKGVVSGPWVGAKGDLKFVVIAAWFGGMGVSHTGETSLCFAVQVRDLAVTTQARDT